MATMPDALYRRFKFVAHIDGAGQDPQGGFDELTADGTSVTLKNGVIRTLEFLRWLDDTRTGDRSAVRTVTIRQQNKHQTVSATWKLVGARIVEQPSGPLNPSGTHVVIDELTLACDGVEVVEE